MRLLEPINGIKSMQGHYLMNFVFFIAMCFISPDIERNMRNEDAYDDLTSGRQIPVLQSDYLMLNSNAHDAAELTPEEQLEHDRLQ